MAVVVQVEVELVRAAAAAVARAAVEVVVVVVKAEAAGRPVGLHLYLRCCGYYTERFAHSRYRYSRSVMLTSATSRRS